MGNESSLPQDASDGSGLSVNDGISDFDDQGQSPYLPNGHVQQQPPPINHLHPQSTSVAAPVSSSMWSLSHANPPNDRRPGDRGPRPGARMIGAVFGKSARTINSTLTQPTQQQQHSQGGGSSMMTASKPAPHNLEDTEKGVVGTMTPGHPLSHSDNASVAHPGLVAGAYNNSYYNSTPSSLQQHPDANSKGGGGDVITSHDYFAQAQHQNMNSAQPAKNPPQQMQQHQQQQQTQYYAGQSHPSFPKPQPNFYERSTSSSYQDVTKIDHPAVGVMYETPSHHQPTPKKSIFPSRATARGAALISSMRNLTLGGALRGKKEVNDWEKQWDADEDDDSDEGDECETSDAKVAASSAGSSTSGLGHSVAGSKGASNGIATTPLHHDGQVAMDVGQSELPMQPLSHGSAGALSADEAASLTHHLIPPDNFDVSKSQQPQQEQQDLAEEWDLAGIQPPTAIVADEETSATTAAPQQNQELAKPNIQMFLPMLRVLGKGSFGKVVLVQKNVGKERGALFAMKILRKTHLVKRRQIERTRTERRVLSVVNHPFIMKLHYAFQTHDKLYLVLDYCPGGELFFHLSRFRRFPERVARFYAAELLLAIGHLHKRGIIYRDLKPENVLLDADGHVKLGDFGLAKAGIQHPCEGASSMCGTPEYMAPEVLAQAGHGFCVDYWGLGMLLYEMMTGLPPWYTTDRAKLFRRLKNAPLDIPSYFSEQAANSVSALLERNPRRRLGVTGIRNCMEHEFFRNISWKSLYARRVEAPIRPCEGWRPPETAGDENDDSMVSATTERSSLFDADSIHLNDLDAATANFDNTFTRMPVESDEIGTEGGEEADMAEQLNEDTFLGFSFDCKDTSELLLHVTSASSSLPSAIDDAAPPPASPPSSLLQPQLHPYT